jgi:hypothetical protein
MIYTIKLCNKTIHNVRSKKKFVCVQTIYCIKDIIYCFLMTYLLLDAINFTRSRICLSEVLSTPASFCVVSHQPATLRLPSSISSPAHGWLCLHVKMKEGNGDATGGNVTICQRWWRIERVRGRGGNMRSNLTTSRGKRKANIKWDVEAVP